MGADACIAPVQDEFDRSSVGTAGCAPTHRPAVQERPRSAANGLDGSPAHPGVRCAVTPSVSVAELMCERPSRDRGKEMGLRDLARKSLGLFVELPDQPDASMGRGSEGEQALRSKSLSELMADLDETGAPRASFDAP